MFQKLDELVEEYDELNETMARPDVAKDHLQLRKLNKRRMDLREVVERYQEFKKVSAEIKDTEFIMDDATEDAELREMAATERLELLEKLKHLKSELQKLLLPKDARDEKNIILEIRAGTGGEEAALFAGDLLRMYIKYAENRKWKIELLNEHTTGVGGYKEAIASISGKNVYSRLKYEGGVHRVQRVPVTEAQGRVHTSAVSVAVLPEAEEVDVDIDEVNDLRIDVYRSSGPGGQSVNTTDSAVRIIHLETGLVVTCQDEKSQHKNRAKALKILRARLFDRAMEEQQKLISQERKKMVSTGDRSVKIRTYNFPQSRVTDHRIGLTLYRLETVLDGDLDEIIDGLTAYYQAEALKAGSN